MTLSPAAIGCDPETRPLLIASDQERRTPGTRDARPGAASTVPPSPTNDVQVSIITIIIVAVIIRWSRQDSLTRRARVQAGRYGGCQRSAADQVPEDRHGIFKSEAFS